MRLYTSVTRLNIAGRRSDILAHWALFTKAAIEQLTNGIGLIQNRLHVANIQDVAIETMRSAIEIHFQ